MKGHRNGRGVAKVKVHNGADVLRLTGICRREAEAVAVS